MSEADLHRRAQWVAVDLELLERLQPPDGKPICHSLFEPVAVLHPISVLLCHRLLKNHRAVWLFAKAPYRLLANSQA